MNVQGLVGGPAFDSVIPMRRYIALNTGRPSQQSLKSHFTRSLRRELDHYSPGKHFPAKAGPADFPRGVARGLVLLSGQQPDGAGARVPDFCRKTNGVRLRRAGASRAQGLFGAVQVPVPRLTIFPWREISVGTGIQPGRPIPAPSWSVAGRRA